MATYYHHSLAHNHHHNHNSDIMSPQQQADGLQTLILMNPNFVGYSESHAPPQQQTSSNFLFHAPTLYHSQSPPLLPQLVGVPLQDTAGYQGTWTTQLGHLQTARDSPRVQQGLSLTLSSTQNHSSDHLQPSPTAVAEGSQSPAAMGDASAMNSSKYLKAAQELLEEMVNVSVDRVKTESGYKKSKSKSESSPGVDSVAGDCSKDELSTSDKQELQMKKAKLITLLDEVDQRQRQYHNQMQAVVASFEQVAGANTARTYTSLALKTISNQFRCLRGAISGQIRIANKGLGEGEGEGGSSSRLKMLDHQIRQQRALQQLGMIQNNAWRPQRGLPEKAVSVLRAWLFEHFLHPYPKDSDKIMLAKQTGLTRSQVSNWFINARVRLWKPMIEEMYAEEVKENEQNGSNGKTRKQDQENEEPGSIDEKDDNLDDEQAKIAENHSSSIMFSSSNPYKPNTENSFAFIESSKMDNDTQARLKKQRTNEILSSFPNSELFNNGCKQEVVPSSASGFLGGLVTYPIGELGRFGDGQYPAGFPANGGVSLTLGLPHCESLNNQVQGFMPNNQDIDQFRGRLELGELNGFGSVKAPNAPHSSNAYSGQLLHDFVA